MTNTKAAPPRLRWSDAVVAPDAARKHSSLTLGVLRGEGIGSEVIGSALEVLESVTARSGHRFDTRFGGLIGRDAESTHGKPLPEEVTAFCQQIFSLGGAVLNGPGGGRYVYDLRKELDLFFKISPLAPCREMEGACQLKPESVRGADILLVRENVGGIYQGSSLEGKRENGGRFVEHRFTDEEAMVHRFLNSAARLAKMRSGVMTVVCKDSGVPGISTLWRDCAVEAAAANGVECSMIDVDLMAYRLIQHPKDFDVIAAPNMCGDVLADLGAVLLGSRGNSFSGNFTPEGGGVYQTNHGAAYDLAGKDRASPVGQILSLAMMLRESFGLGEQARWVEEAVRAVWAAGWRTADTAEPGCKILGTQEMTARIAESVAEGRREAAAA